MKKISLPNVIKLAGGYTALAKRLKCTKQAISAWKQVPSERVLAVEKITGISRYELRPDIFGAAP